MRFGHLGMTGCILLALLLSLPFSARAAHDQASLAAEIKAANRAGSGSISLRRDIILSAPLPVISGHIAIDGAGHSISGGEQFRIFAVDSGRLRLSDMTLRDAKAPEDEYGGAVWLRNQAEFSAERVAFRDNHAQRGGAIASEEAAAQISISQSSFIGNSAVHKGGAIFSRARQTDIARSSFHQNWSESYAGAIAAYGASMAISNSTFYNNAAGVGNDLEVFIAEVTLTHVTILKRARSFDSNAIHRTAGTIRLRNSIVAGIEAGYRDNCTNGLAEAKGNISSDGTCALLEQKLDPLLGEITGWPGWLPLLDHSPALDAADPEFCLPVDQRGMPRPHGEACDAGAIESRAAQLAPTPILPPPGCPLADAIIAANTDKPAGACFAGSGHDIITLDKDHILRASLPPITSQITIEGNGHIINGDHKYRIFDVAGGELTIKDMTLAHGSGVDGGALRLRENASVSVDKVAFLRNRATNGGAIASLSDSAKAVIRDSVFENNAADDWGGAIRAQRGSVTIAGSAFKGNRAQAFGGALNGEYGSFTVSDSTFTKNRAAAGGVIHLDYGSATLTHLTMVANEADQLNGDAIHSWGGSVFLRNSIIDSSDQVADDCDAPPTESSGNLNPDGTCGVPAGTESRLSQPTGSPAYFPLLDDSPALHTADSRYCSERDQIGTPRPQGPGCDIGAIEAMTASAAKPTPAPTACTLYDQILAANSDRRAGQCPAGSGADTISLSQDIVLTARLPRITAALTIEGNGHSISGGERFPIFIVEGAGLTVRNLTLRDGYHPRSSGGAIQLLGSASAIVVDSRFINNHALAAGAIAAHATGLVVKNSSFVGNSAERDGGAIDMRSGRLEITGSSFVDNQAGFGGAVSTTTGDSASISNSTFSGNQAISRGGAIHAEYPPMTLTHLTLLDNMQTGYGAPKQGHAIFVNDNNQGLYLRNSIIGGSRRARHCVGRLSQSAGNLVEGDSCAPAIDAAPTLAELHGWPGFHAPLPGSPAIGAAAARYCLDADQRGAARPAFGCDIGAIEMPPVIREINGCLVTTTHGLNFRAGPGGQRIGSVLENMTLPASRRTEGWFQVELNGAQGWISADYVVAEGACD